MMNFSNETINQIVYAINENASDIKSLVSSDAEKSIQERAEKLLEDKYNIPHNEAEDIVGDLLKGVYEFDEQMKNTTGEGTQISVRQNLEELSEGMNEDARLDYYASILTAIQMMTSGDTDDVENVYAENLKLGLDELIVKIEETINNDISLEVIGNSVKEGVDAGTLEALATKIEMNKKEFRFNAALWIYILQRDGVIKLTESEVALTPATIGTLAAAGVETIIKTNELKQGKISLETWQIVIKWILGIAIFAILTIGMGCAITYVGLSLMTAIIGLLGGGILSAIVGVIVPVAFILASADKLSDLNLKAMHWLSDFYDKYIVVVTEKAEKLIAKVKEVASMGVAKFIAESKSNAQTESESTTNKQQTAKPVMA